MSANDNLSGFVHQPVNRQRIQIGINQRNAVVMSLKVQVRRG